jgi:tRNA(Ile)-lysidine synthetase-like protein
MRLSVGYDFISLSLPDVEIPLPHLPQLVSDEPVRLSVPGRLGLANGWALEAEWLPITELMQIEQNENRWIAYLDGADWERLAVRPRLAGERFQPLGMAGHSKSVKAVMIDRKIPVELRPLWPIVAAAHLLWIPGHVLDERVRVRADSERILKLEVRLF